MTDDTLLIEFARMGGAHMGPLTVGGVEYVTGLDRNESHQKAHLYRGAMADPGDPMCWRGWNRMGVSYSIFRNNAPNGVCGTCIERARQKLQPVPPRARKTKWI